MENNNESWWDRHPLFSTICVLLIVDAVCTTAKDITRIIKGVCEKKEEKE